MHCRKYGLLFICAAFVMTFLVARNHQLYAQSGIGKNVAASAVPAQDFQLEDLKGAKVKLSDFRGKRPVLLYFGAKWCPACQAARPSIIAMRMNTKEEDLAMLEVYIGTRDTLEEVKRYDAGHPAPFPVLYDKDATVARTYGIMGIPSFILVSREGTVVFRDYELPKDISQYTK